MRSSPGSQRANDESDAEGAVTFDLAAFSKYESLTKLLDAQLSVWPEHARFLARRFPETTTNALGDVDELARLVLCLAGDALHDHCADYRWVCDRIKEETLHFARTGNYRLRTFQAAFEEVYENHAYMTRYLNGLLLSQVWWANHTASLLSYRASFLPHNQKAYRHLEVGPGHGLFLFYAAADPRCQQVTAWDVSEASLMATKAALATLGVTRDCTLERRSVFEPNASGAAFDSVVISEVCEHLERPDLALANLRTFLAPEGRLFVNVPVNSPAPDHIYLLRSPEEAIALVRGAGFAIEEVWIAPPTGYTEEAARRQALTLSCAMSARAAR